MWLLYGLLAAWLSVLAGAVAFAWWFLSGLGNRVVPRREPAVAVIAPVKGASPHLLGFLGRLRAQDYGRYRVMAVVQAETDPAYPVLLAEVGRPGARLDVLVAGLAVDEGQKVHNQLHALERLEDADEVLAFVDADTAPRPDWLTRLVEPLTRGTGIDVVTGHRWVQPVLGNLPAALAAAATNSVVAAPRLIRVVWGGSFAMRRETAERIELRRRWRGAVVDDVYLTRILHEHGLRVLTPRDLLVLSPAEHTLRSALAFGRRQYLFIRWYLPRVWLLAAAIITVPVLAAPIALAASLDGDPVAIGALVVAVGLGQARGSMRRRVVQRIWGEELQDAYRPADRVVRYLAPAWIALHALAIWTTVVGRRMRWGGVLYRFDDYDRVRTLSRPRSPSEPPETWRN